ncbi:hypothetical protein Emtol_1000 [Emticicia oligotrophica DSM 17448]|jgi:hypothetical protein|uniref:Uncharacterized protein n=1 Tax=Emticicia oligotrophica (strain DSM 17448 / CIP 109782 / MTCC 6937 / GPTSA100-15) TaxID=929562 RepID=A0ABM5MYG9_EMTOG|nr:hypothetical protein [Emticicia oligotrophica]AFK02151.1 hypothetical protein Emtol_1000 [Emticicia oligotrophica DSM 17448]
METIIVIICLLLGLITSLSLILFSEQFSLFVTDKSEVNLDWNQRQQFFKKIKNNFARIKHIHT